MLRLVDSEAKLQLRLLIKAVKKDKFFHCGFHSNQHPTIECMSFVSACLRPSGVFL